MPASIFGHGEIDAFVDALFNKPSSPDLLMDNRGINTAFHLLSTMRITTSRRVIKTHRHNYINYLFELLCGINFFNLSVSLSEVTKKLSRSIPAQASTILMLPNSCIAKSIKACTEALSVTFKTEAIAFPPLTIIFCLTVFKQLKKYLYALLETTLATFKYDLFVGWLQL